MHTQDHPKFPYKIQSAQRLTEDAIYRRLSFASDFCELIDQNKVDINKIIFSDEAHFWLDGYVNRQNYRIWGSEKPEMLATSPLHPQKLTVWCGLSSEGIVGPIFINESINADVSEGILEEYFLKSASDMGWLDGRHWFQQDGAPPQTTHSNLAIINKNFGKNVMALKYPETFGEGMIWPPYSPDLSPLDFFLWGYMKDKVYKKAPKTLQELQSAVSDVIGNIPADMRERAIGSFESRLRMLILTEGRHIENIIH